MGLIASLGLKPPKNWPAAASTTRPAPSAAAAAAPTAPPPRPAAAPGSAVATPMPATRAAAAALRPQIEREREAARKRDSLLAAEQARLAAQIKAAKGPAKAALEARKTKVDALAKAAAEEVATADADLAAIDDPSTRGDVHTRLLARRKAAGTVAREAHVDTGEVNVARSPLRRKVVQATSSYANGQAVNETHERSRSVDFSGLSQTDTQMREEVSADGTSRRTQARSTRVSLDGIGHERTDTEEVQAGEQKASVAHKQSMSVGPGGATSSQTTTLTRADGSSLTQSQTVAVERGDGVLAASRSQSRTDKAADESETTVARSSKAGLVADKDTLGALAQQKTSLERSTASGVKTGTQAALDGKVTWKLTTVKGSAPPQFDLQLTVDLGVALGASASKESKHTSAALGEVKSRVGASASKGRKLRIERSFRLGAEQAHAYDRALKDAAGGKGSGTETELAIVRTAASQGWAAARELYLAITGEAGSAQAGVELRAGESRSLSHTDDTALGASAGISVAGVAAGASKRSTSTAKVTRTDDNLLRHDMAAGETDKREAAASLDMAYAGMKAGGSRTLSTSTGYVIVVDPKAANAAALQQALAGCRSQADLDAFAKKYPQTVQRKTVRKAQAETEDTEFNLLGKAKLGINLGQGVAQEETVDGQGRRVERVITGSSSGGASMSLGDTTFAGSSQRELKARIDAKGNAAAEITQSSTSTDVGAKLRGLLPDLPFFGDDAKAKDAPGLLTRAAGGGAEDTDRHDVAGLVLGNADLDRIGAMACGDWKTWVGLASSLHRSQKDWSTAGTAIRAAGGERTVVAEQLALFVGKSKSDRAALLMRILRGRNQVDTGMRSEFPGKLGALKDRYDEVVLAESEAAVLELLDRKGAAAATAAAHETLQALDTLQTAIAAARDFAHVAVRAEMLSDINARREKVLAALRTVKGVRQADAAELRARFDADLATCRAHQQTEAACFEELAKLTTDWRMPVPSKRLMRALHLLDQLVTLHRIWWPDYERLAAAATQAGVAKSAYAAVQPDRQRRDGFDAIVRVQGVAR